MKRSHSSARAICDGPVILLLPKLAPLLSAVEAALLQQIHYWLSVKGNTGAEVPTRWVFHTYAQWAEQLGFWNESTIRRAMNRLETLTVQIEGETRALVRAEQRHQDPRNRTKFYTIDYEVLSLILRTVDEDDDCNCSNRSDAPGPEERLQAVTIDGCTLEHKNTEKKLEKESWPQQLLPASLALSFSKNNSIACENTPTDINGSGDSVKHEGTENLNPHIQILADFLGRQVLREEREKWIEYVESNSPLEAATVLAAASGARSWCEANNRRPSINTLIVQLQKVAVRRDERPETAPAPARRYEDPFGDD